MVIVDLGLKPSEVSGELILEQLDSAIMLGKFGARAPNESGSGSHDGGQPRDDPFYRSPRIGVELLRNWHCNGLSSFGWSRRNHCPLTLGRVIEASKTSGHFAWSRKTRIEFSKAIDPKYPASVMLSTCSS